MPLEHTCGRVHQAVLGCWMLCQESGKSCESTTAAGRAAPPCSHSHPAPAAVSSAVFWQELPAYPSRQLFLFPLQLRKGISMSNINIEMLCVGD